MRLRIKSYSPCCIPDCEQFPDIHVVGETLPRVIFGRQRMMHGTVTMISDGSVRWNLVSSAVVAPCALAERMSDRAHLAVLYGGGRRQTSSGSRKASRYRGRGFHWAYSGYGPGYNASGWILSVRSLRSQNQLSITNRCICRTVLGVEGRLKWHLRLLAL